MSDKTETQVHPMAKSMFAFVNEALTLEELKARLNLMSEVVKNIEADIAKIEAPKEEEAEVEPTKEEKIAAYAASLEA